MMETIQWFFNLAFVGIAVFVWWKNKKVNVLSNHKQVVEPYPKAETVQQLEIRIAQLENQLQNFQEIFQHRIKEVELVLEQTNKALKSVKSAGGPFPLTQEESELKETLYFNAEKEEIPSVAFLESTKIRLQRESNLDLKTLLRGQLS